MIHLDTNYILRYLLKDNKKHLDEASKLLDNEEIELYIPALVFAECCYFLGAENQYNQPKEVIISSLKGLLQRKNLYTAGYIELALDIYAINSISFYDCLILAETISSKGELRTFDKNLNKVFNKAKNSQIHLI